MSSLRHDDIHQTSAPERDGEGWKSGWKREKRERGTKGRFDRGDVPRTKVPGGATISISNLVCHSHVEYDRILCGDCLSSERKEMDAPGVAPLPQAKARH